MKRRDFLKLAPKLGLAALALPFVSAEESPREPQPVKPVEVAEHQKPLVEMYPQPKDGTKFLSKDGLFEFRRPDGTWLKMTEAEHRASWDNHDDHVSAHAQYAVRYGYYDHSWSPPTGHHDHDTTGFPQ